MNKMCKYLGKTFLIAVIIAFVFLHSDDGLYPRVNASYYTGQLKDTTAGDTIIFGGREWHVMNPSTGYLLMKDIYTTHAWHVNNISWDISQIINYLESQFNNIITNEEDRLLVQTKDWDYNNELGGNKAFDTIINPINANQKIGLISYAEWQNRPLGVTNPTSWAWTRTPFSTSSYSVYNINIDGILERTNRYANDETGSIRPAIYIDPEVNIINGVVTILPPNPLIDIVNVAENTIVIRDIQSYLDDVVRKFIINGESTPWIDDSEYTFTQLNPNIQQQITIQVKRAGEISYEKIIYNIFCFSRNGYFLLFAN